MAIRAGQILVDASGFILDRVQSGGPTLNVPLDQIREVGNFKLVGVVRDTPDLTYTVQSLDVSTDIEAIMLGLTPSSVVAGPGGGETQLDFNNSVLLDVLSPFRSGRNKFNITSGIIVPCLNLETVSYKFGLRANAEETFTLRGDSVYFVPGGLGYRDVVAPGTLNGGGSYVFAHGPAIEYVERGFPQWAVSVSWVDLTTGNATSGLSQRLFHDSSRSTFDFFSSPTGLTLHAGVVIPATATVYVCYGSAANPGYTSTSPVTSPVSAVKPAALRSKDIDVFLSVPGATSTVFRLSGVQSYDCTRKVTLQNMEEFGNPHYVTQDYDTAEVTGSIGIKGVTPADLFTKIQDFAGVFPGQVSGPLTSPPLELVCKLYDPGTGATIKTIYVPDATFTDPGVNAQVNQQLAQTFPFTSDTGSVYVFKGDM